jgi:hypothetical protein
MALFYLFVWLPTALALPCFGVFMLVKIIRHGRTSHKHHRGASLLAFDLLTPCKNNRLFF